MSPRLGTAPIGAVSDKIDSASLYALVDGFGVEHVLPARIWIACQLHLPYGRVVSTIKKRTFADQEPSTVVVKRRAVGRRSFRTLQPDGAS